MLWTSLGWEGPTPFLQVGRHAGYQEWAVEAQGEL